MKKTLLLSFCSLLLIVIPACRSRKKEPRKNTSRQMHVKAMKQKKAN